MRKRESIASGVQLSTVGALAALSLLAYLLWDAPDSLNRYLVLFCVPVILLLSSGQQIHFSLRPLFFGLWLGCGMYTLVVVELSDILEQSPSPLLFIAMVCGLSALLFSFMLAGLEQWLKKREDAPVQAASQRLVYRETLLFAVYAGASFALLYGLKGGFWSFPDTVDQFAQINGTMEYSSIHAIGHTLLLKLLYAVLPSYQLMVAFGLVLAVLLLTLLVHRLLKAGVSLIWPLMLLTLLLWECETMAIFISLLKDVPYTLCIGLTVYFLMRMVEGDTLKFWNCLAMGLSLGLTMVFRLNGFVPVALTLLALLVWYGKRHDLKRPLCILAACAVTFVGVNTAAKAVLKPVEIPNGYAYCPFAIGVATVIGENGAITEAQQEIINQYLPYDYIREHYDPYHPANLIWSKTFGWDSPYYLLNNEFVLAVAEHPAEIIKLYFSLLPANMKLMCKSVFQSVYAFVCFSDPKLLENHVLLLVLLLFSASVLWRGREKRRGWIVLIPVLGNCFSILISTVTNEVRYMLPTYYLFPVLLPYIVAFARNHREADEAPKPV